MQMLRDARSEATSVIGPIVRSDLCEDYAVRDFPSLEQERTRLEIVYVARFKWFRNHLHSQDFHYWSRWSVFDGMHLRDLSEDSTILGIHGVWALRTRKQRQASSAYELGLAC
jgi:hypothetical protein